MTGIRSFLIMSVLLCLLLGALQILLSACDSDDDDDVVQIDQFCDKIEDCEMLDRFDFKTRQDCLTDYEEVGYERANCVTFTADCDEMAECLDEVEEGEDDDAGDDNQTGDDGGAETLAWEFVPVDGAKCRDGSDTGIGVRYNTNSKNLAILLDGGGACVSLDSCLSTPARFNEEKLEWMASEESWDLYAGIFNPFDDRNPVKDWNFIYVPYCTGDMHMGNREDALVPGLLKRQQFVGFANLQRFLNTVKSIFPSPPKVLLMGVSAGGFGSLVAYPLVAEGFPDSDVILIDDSGPLFEDDEALSPCYQAMMRLMFNIDPSIPEGCSACRQANGDGLVNIFPYLAETYPAGRFGLFSTMADRSIRDTFGPGRYSCLALLGMAPSTLPRDLLWEALIDLRDELLLPTGSWSTFYSEGATHGVLPYEFETLLGDEASFYEMEAEGIPLYGWVEELIETVPEPVGP